MKYFCIIQENIAYMECVIQSSMFYSFYLFLSVLLGNVDSAVVSDSNAYIWIRILLGVSAERDVTQEGSREQMWERWTNVTYSIVSVCL